MRNESLIKNNIYENILNKFPLVLLLHSIAIRMYQVRIQTHASMLCMKRLQAEARMN